MGFNKVRFDMLKIKKVASLLDFKTFDAYLTNKEVIFFNNLDTYNFYCEYCEASKEDREKKYVSLRSMSSVT